MRERERGREREKEKEGEKEREKGREREKERERKRRGEREGERERKRRGRDREKERCKRVVVWPYASLQRGVCVVCSHRQPDPSCGGTGSAMPDVAFTHHWHSVCVRTSWCV